MSDINRRARFTALIASGTLAAAATLGAAPAQAAPTGTTSLAEVLAADGNRLDRKWDDFDIAERAIKIVLRATDGQSDVAVLADGDTALTAFVPTDRAFRRLVKSVTGHRPHTERGTLRQIKKLFDAPTLEAVLLYHVVPGATITYRQARMANGAVLNTALEDATIKVRVRGWRVKLVDADRDAWNPRVMRSAKNINKGNLQIAHGINRVLRPVDLPRGTD